MLAEWRASAGLPPTVGLSVTEADKGLMTASPPLCLVATRCNYGSSLTHSRPSFAAFFAIKSPCMRLCPLPVHLS